MGSISLGGTSPAPISVVIATLDDRATLRDCVDGVLGAGVAVGEVLVVDRGSGDGTAALARRIGAPVRLIERPGASAAGALAAATVEAAGPVVVVPSRAVLGAGALSTGGAVELRPVGTTAFGRAAAAVVAQVRTLPAPAGAGLQAQPAPAGAGRQGPAAPAGAGPATGRSRPSWYFVADRPAGLAAEAFHAGVGARQGGLLAAALALAVAGRGWARVAVPLAHAGVTAVRALRAGQDPGVAPHRAFLAAEIWDWAAGAGWWAHPGRRAP